MKFGKYVGKNISLFQNLIIYKYIKYIFLILIVFKYVVVHVIRFIRVTTPPPTPPPQKKLQKCPS